MGIILNNNKQNIGHGFVDITGNGSANMGRRPFNCLLLKVRAKPVGSVVGSPALALDITGVGTESVKTATTIAVAGTTVFDRNDDGEIFLTEATRLKFTISGANAADVTRVHYEYLTS